MMEITDNLQNEHLSRIILLQNTTAQPGNSSTNGTSPADPPADGESGWLGLNSTQLLIVFLIIVFAILILFLLIYYYVIKGMRQRSISKLAQKSISGSIGEGKDRNIFANPERQMAVDQSTRASSHSPASSSDVEPIAPSNNSGNPSAPTSSQQQQQSVPTLTASTKFPTGSGPKAIPPPVTLAKAPTSPVGSSRVTQPPTPAAATTAQASSKAAQPQESSQSKKSRSDSRRRRDRIEADMHDPHSIMGALAGLRDTLKDADLHR